MKKILILVIIPFISLNAQIFNSMGVSVSGAEISSNQEYSLISSVGNPSYSTILNQSTVLKLGILTLVNKTIPIKVEDNSSDRIIIGQATPNPAKDWVNFTIFSKNSFDIDLEIYNSIGIRINYDKITVSEGQSNLRLRLDNFQTGIYFVRFTLHNLTIVKKIVVTR